MADRNHKQVERKASSIRKAEITIRNDCTLLREKEAKMVTRRTSRRENSRPIARGLKRIKTMLDFR